MPCYRENRRFVSLSLQLNEAIAGDCLCGGFRERGLIFDSFELGLFEAIAGDGLLRALLDVIENLSLKAEDTE